MHPLLLLALVLYGIFLLFYIVHSIFLIYHLVRFSVRPDTVKVIAGIFLAVSAVLFVLGLSVLGRVSWEAPLFRPYGAPVSSGIL